MRLVSVALALAGCHPSAPKPSSAGSPPYLVLFERGRSWSLPIENVTGRKQARAWVATKTERGTINCQVADVKPIGDGTVSRISCAVPNAGLLVVGTWVQTPAGLYHPLLPVDDADELALLGEDDLLLSAIPKERQHSHVLGEAQDSVEAFSFKRSWCVRDTTATETDRRAFTLCFDAGGVTGGGELLIVGSEQTWHRAQFGTVPPDPDDPTTNYDD